MNIFKLLSLSNFYFSLVKLAAEDVFAPKSISEAKILLSISLDEDLTAELLNKKFKAAVLKHHPDKGGSEEMFKRVNAARDYLMLFTIKPNNKPDVKPEEVVDEDEDEDDFLGNPFNASYEEIADARNRMGRERFNKKYPD